MASLYGPSYSGIFAKEIKNIREEQKIQEGLIEKDELEELEEKEKQKMIGGGVMQLGASIGKFAEKSAASKLEEASQFVNKQGIAYDVKKYETIAGTDAPKTLFGEPLGDTTSGLWERATDYLNVDFAGETTQLTPEYITAGIESGKGVSELGVGEIGKLFDPVQTSSGTLTPQVGATEKIMATIGKGDAAKQIQVGTATLGKGGEVTSEILKGGIKEAAAGSATTSAGSIAGTAMAGLGIAAGGYQMLTGEDDQTKIAGGLKAVGSGLMLTGAGAPIGLALTGIGTLLDFI